jgi:hypothetical protein
MAESNGKGDRYRKVDKEKYDRNWKRIFMRCEFFCKEVIKGHSSCDRCKYNEDAVLTSQILYCPKTGVEPNESN